jgi:hypothetical protein
MVQFLRGKMFQSVADVEVVVEEFLLPKIKSGFTRHSRNWLKNGRRPLNMRACILYIELLILYVLANNIFISNPTLFMGHPQYVLPQEKSICHSSLGTQNIRINNTDLGYRPTAYFKYQNRLILLRDWNEVTRIYVTAKGEG